MNKTIWMWILIAVIVIAGGWYFYSKTQPINPSDLTAGYWKDVGLKDTLNLTGRKQACEAKLHSCFQQEAGYNKFAVEILGEPGSYAGFTMGDLANNRKWCINQCFGSELVCTVDECIYRCIGARVLPEESIGPGCNQVMVDTTEAI